MVTIFPSPVLTSGQQPSCTHPVMPVAEQDLVFDLSAAAVQPMHDVMSVTCRRRSFAAGPLAVFIPRDQSPAARTFDRSLAPPDVDHHRVLHQDPAQAGVAGPALHLLGSPRRGCAGGVGRENSLSAPGAPTRSSSVSSELVTCIWILVLLAASSTSASAQRLGASR